jgi:hypothetical protein
MIICAPALIYVAFSLAQIIIDTIKGLYNTAMMKVFVMIIITILLNILCKSGMGIISWILVFIPFILMSIIVGILLYTFGLDPETGKLSIPCTKVPETKKSGNLVYTSSDYISQINNNNDLTYTEIYSDPEFH